MHASTRTRFKEAYRDIADRLKLPERNNPNIDVLRLVNNWLCDEANGQWTMILDNVDDVETFFPSQNGKQDESASLAEYLPQSCNGSILITSRNKDAADRLVGGYRRIKEIRAMDKNQGLQLLRNKLEDTSSEEGAVDLLHTLDYIPLAIAQAAAYINRRARITISSYLDEFRANYKKREYFLNWDAGDLRRDKSASNSVVTTWQMSFERIRQERPSAAELLLLMSFFNPQGIPVSTLRNYSRTIARPGCKDEADSAFEDDFDTLHAYSLISVTAETDTCEMHALVQFCTQVWLSSFSDIEQWKQKFVELMAREFPTGRFENWAKCQQLLPHIESLYDSKPATNKSIDEWAEILTNAAWYMWMKGSYKIAQNIVTKALTARENVLGQDNPRTIDSVIILALVLQYQGKYDEAEKLNRRALEGSEKELGVQHPDTLTSVANLASVLQYQGKYDEAEKLGQRALEGREKELGVQHPDTLTSVANLASVLQYQGKYDEAEKLNRRALEGCEKKLGIQHPDTLISVSNLASVLQKQGKYDEVEKLNRRALEGLEKELGKDHPDTLTSACNLAYLLHKQKRYEEASGLYQRACDGLKQKLGSQHPDTIACLHYFSVMQQEVEQERLGQSRTPRYDDRVILRDTSIDSFSSLYNGTTPASTSSSQKNKQDSIYARLKTRFSGKGYSKKGKDRESRQVDKRSGEGYLS